MPKQQRPALSFEQGLEEMEKVIQELEGGKLPLEKVLQRFEKDVELLKTCRKQLEATESKVEILLKKNDRAQTEPFDPENDGRQRCSSPR